MEVFSEKEDTFKTPFFFAATLNKKYKNVPLIFGETKYLLETPCFCASDVSFAASRYDFILVAKVDFMFGYDSICWADNFHRLRL